MRSHPPYRMQFILASLTLFTFRYDIPLESSLLSKMSKKCDAIKRNNKIRRFLCVSTRKKLCVCSPVYCMAFPSLSLLAREYNKIAIFTIHFPRSFTFLIHSKINPEWEHLSSALSNLRYEFLMLFRRKECWYYERARERNTSHN